MRLFFTTFGGVGVAVLALSGSVSAASFTIDQAGIAFEARAVATPALRELANGPANTALLRNPRRLGTMESLRHRYPANALFRNALAGLPVIDATNAYPIVPALNSPPASIGGFTGIYDGSSAAAIGGDLEPPDQGLAVNNGEVVEIVNNALQIFKSTGAAITNPINNATFFGLDATFNLSDPHVVFDPPTQRWFIEELIFSNSFNGFAVAVSKTADPAGSYFVYRIDDRGATIPGCQPSCLPDYPQVGIDANGFYIAADLFNNSSGNFINAGIYALPKAALVKGASLSYAYFVDSDFVVQPAIAAPGQAFASAANGTEYLMAARNIFDGSSNVRVLAITNTNSLKTTPALKLHALDLRGELYRGTVAATQPNVVGPYGKSQGATSAPKLDGGYDAFGGGVKYANGQLYTALTSGSKDSSGLARNVIAYFVVKPSVGATGTLSGAIASQGYVIPPTGYSIAYPGLAINKSGIGVLGMSIVNSNAKAIGGYPSTAAIEFVNGKSLGNLLITGAGATSDDGFTGYSGSSAVTGRWGDYASATVDPVTGYFWTANEFIPQTATYPRGSAANWGTFVTQIH